MIEMDDNQLGRNIQHLRIIHNETLEELGGIIHCAKSTVKDTKTEEEDQIFKHYNYWLRIITNQ